MKKRLTVALLSLFLSGLFLTDSALAQDAGWTKPYQIIANGNSSPIVADPAGNLHLLFLAYAGREPESAWAGDTIFYVRWSDGQWSSPVDILVSDLPNDTLRMPALGVTPDGYLHVIWYGNLALYHSWAHASQGSDARSWRTETLTSDRIPTPALAIDKTGTLHVVYSSEMSAVKYTRMSPDGTWSEPVRIWEVSDPSQFAVAHPQVAVDAQGTIHVGWTENAEQSNWGQYSAWYARSTDGGATWSDLRLLATPEYGLDTVIVAEGNMVLAVVWRGIGYRDGRFYAVSTDSGQTWSELRPLFPSLDHASGSTGGSGWALDSNGVVHLVNSAGRQGGKQEILHTFWLGDRWAEPVLLDVLAEVPRIAVVGGNQLHVVYSRGGLWHTQKVIDAPALPLQALPSLIEPTYAVKAGEVPEAGDRTSAPSREVKSPTQAQALGGFTTRPSSQPSSWVPVIVGVVPVLLLILGVLLFRREIRLGRQ